MAWVDEVKSKRIILKHMRDGAFMLRGSSWRGTKMRDGPGSANVDVQDVLHTHAVCPKLPTAHYSILLAHYIVHSTHILISGEISVWYEDHGQIA